MTLILSSLINLFKNGSFILSFRRKLHSLKFYSNLLKELWVVALLKQFFVIFTSKIVFLGSWGTLGRTHIGISLKKVLLKLVSVKMWRIHMLLCQAYLATIKWRRRRMTRMFCVFQIKISSFELSKQLTYIVHITNFLSSLSCNFPFAAKKSINYQKRIIFSTILNKQNTRSRMISPLVFWSKI